MGRITVADTSAMIDQISSQTAPLQWLRELYLNSAEADATRVETIPFNDTLYNAFGADKFMIADNGHGMTGPELGEYMRSIKKSGKTTGGAHEHQGMGARITTLQWNQAGVVVISLCSGEMNMVWMWKNPSTGEYELNDFEIEIEDGETEYTEVVPLHEYEEDSEFGIDEIGYAPWYQVVPDWVKADGHGTVVILLGNTPDQDSIMGDPRVKGESWREAREQDITRGTWVTPRKVKQVTEVGEKVYRQLPEWNYLTGRFWVLERETDIPGYGTWTASDVNSEWQVSDARATGLKSGGTGKTRAGKATSTSDAKPVLGGLRDIYKHKSLSVEHGTVDLHHPNLPARVHWFLRDGSPTATGYRGDVEMGYLAALYQDEIYERHRRFRPWGIPYREVQDRVFLVVEPITVETAVTEVKGTEGVRPNMERSLLLWGPENLTTLPWDEWGAMFRSEEYLPVEIEKALAEYVARQPASEMVDPEVLRRVMDHVDATYETDQEILRRLATAKSKYKGSRDKVEEDESGDTTKTKKLVTPTKLTKPERDPLPPHEKDSTPGRGGGGGGDTSGGGTSKGPRRPTKVTARRKANEGGKLLNEPGNVPGTLKTLKGGPPDIRWVLQKELADSSEGEDHGTEKHIGAIWDSPGGEHKRGLLRLAKDHWSVERVITRLMEDLPHVPEPEVRKGIQNAIAGSVCLRLLTVRKMKDRFGSTDTLRQMLDPLALTNMMVMSNLEYDAVKNALLRSHGSPAGAAKKRSR